VNRKDNLEISAGDPIPDHKLGIGTPNGWKMECCQGPPPKVKFIERYRLNFWQGWR